MNHHYTGLLGGIGFFNLLIASCLLVGGILVLKMKPKTPAFLTTVFACAILFEIAACVAGTFVQMKVGAVLSETMPRMMTSAVPKGGQGADEAAAMATVFTKVAYFAGVAITIGWALAKMIFYGFSISYLRRPKIRRLFGESPTDQM